MNTDFFYTFPAMPRSELRHLKKSIDLSFVQFSQHYGSSIEHFFHPLLTFLINVDKFFTHTPWIFIILLAAAISWIASRNYKLVIGVVCALMLVGYLGMWPDCMATIAIVIVATILCIILGIPTGILMSRHERLCKTINPVLDLMQTIPSFVYLIPIMMLLGIGKVPGLIAICVYAIPPVIRLTNLGIREVNADLKEAINAFGATALQRLIKVELPLALPAIFTGINQTIMMALAMVVIASMIGVQGLGMPILLAINGHYLALGLLNGLAIVVLAIIFDRISQSYAIRLQTYRNNEAA